MWRGARTGHGVSGIGDGKCWNWEEPYYDGRYLLQLDSIVLELAKQVLQSATATATTADGHVATVAAIFSTTAVVDTGANKSGCCYQRQRLLFYWGP